MMQARFLTGERVYLRAMLASDKECAAAWFDSPFPIDASRAETWLKEVHRRSWPPPPRPLAIVRLATGEVVGGLRVASWNRRAARIAFHMAPWAADADDLRAEVLRLVVPWQRDECEMMIVRVGIADDEPATRAAAEGLGMVAAARLRQRLARPGGRVDQVLYEAYNPRWEVRDA